MNARSPRLCVLIALALALLSAWPQAHARPPAYVTALEGETLPDIAKRTGCSLEKLRLVNSHIKDDRPRPARRVTLPRSCGNEITYEPSARFYVARSNDTVESVAREHQCKKRDLIAASKLRHSNLRRGWRIVLPSSCRGEDSPAAGRRKAEFEARALRLADPADLHVAQSGETLEDVVATATTRCDASWIATVNGLEPDAELAEETPLKLPFCKRVDSAPRATVVDSERLREVMAERDYRGAKSFRAYVIAFKFDEKNERIVEERRFDYSGRSGQVSGWNPASTVKVFPVIAALQRAREEGFSTRAHVTFFKERYDHEITLHDLVVNTLVDSNNMSYNRLVQLAGFDYLNGRFLTPRNGFSHSAVLRAYDVPQWTRQGETRDLRVAPPIELREGGRRLTLSAQQSAVTTPCRGSACTTLQDLGEAMRRLMLQELLPAEQTFDMHPDDLALMRQAMSHERRRGNQVANIFRALIKGPGVRVYNKPGYSQRWFSDTLFIHDPDNHRAWVVVMTAKRGRRGLSNAARVLARVLRAEEL